MRKRVRSALASRGPELCEVTGGQRVEERGCTRPGSHPNRCPSLLLAGERRPRLSKDHFRCQMKVINLTELLMLTGWLIEDRLSNLDGDASWSGIKREPLESLVSSEEAALRAERLPAVTPTRRVATHSADIINVAQLTPSEFMCACREVRKCW